MVQDDPSNPSFSSITEEDAELVEHQLSQILESPHFKSAKQMQNFLQYIVRKALAGKANSLKQYTIAVEALGFPVDFDSDTNPVVRIKAGRVRDRLESYYENEGVTAPLVITIPKGGYIPFFEKKPRVHTGKSVASDGSSLPPMLAVLCYSDETQDKASNRLLFQITDTMAIELSHFLFTRLVVSVPHADKKESRYASIEIKERYQADYMLIFYIQQLQDDQHTLVARLMEVENEEILWSESFELGRDKIFSEQPEIIGNITAVIADIQQGILHRHWAKKLLENEDEIRGHHKALAYYRRYSDTLGIDSFKKSVEVCEKQLEKNPNDIICKVLYADYCRRDYVYDFGVIDDPLKTGKKHAQEAVQLRPDSHETHFVLGQILFCLNENNRCISELNLARDICQYHACVEYGIGFNFCLLGKWDEGWAIVENVMKVSPNYPSWFNIVPFLYYYQQDKYDDALNYALKIDVPIIFHGALARCASYGKLGEKEKSQKELQGLLDSYPNFMEIGKPLLTRFLGSEKLADKLWEGISN